MPYPMQAHRRLELLAACHDDASRRRAAALGVGPGWRCLDAGAGQGSFARWLASRVGPDGHVVAADVDVTLMADIDELNLDVREMDLTRDDLPRDSYDLVHTRLALLHIPERETVLARLAAALRPGGLLLLEEDDGFPILATASGEYRAAWEVFLRIMAVGGTHPAWAQPPRAPRRARPRRRRRGGRRAALPRRLDDRRDVEPDVGPGARTRARWTCRSRTSIAAAPSSAIPIAGSTAPP
jgi:SAM-dependent methyltransferase